MIVIIKGDWLGEGGTDQWESQHDAEGRGLEGPPNQVRPVDGVHSEEPGLQLVPAGQEGVPQQPPLLQREEQGGT